MKRIAIVGHGFVGTAMDYIFTHEKVEKDIYDPKYGNPIENMRDPNSYHAIFICVPTPMGEGGKIDSSILDSVMKRILPATISVNTVIVIKSTVTPDIIEKYDVQGVVYNPEFLTEASAKADASNPEFHVMGGDLESCLQLAELYTVFSLCPPVKIFQMTMKEASLVKYAINSFLALKVSFFNQLYDAASDEDISFTAIMKAVGADSRIGMSHTRVPGYDSKRGYGGACFPKDTQALINYSDRFTLVEECVRINNKYRQQYDLDEREIAQNVIYYEQIEEEQSDHGDRGSLEE
jgi:UDPglucose 6-dehydrogenase